MSLPVPDEDTLSTTSKDSSNPSGGPADATPVPKATINPSIATTSNTASHQHQQEQEMLQSYAVPNPPVSTQQSSMAAEKESGYHGDPPRTLWMGDLDPWLDESGIIDLWWQVLGKRVFVKIIKPKIAAKNDTYQGLSHSGYCFVEFESFEDAQHALTLNGQLLPDMAMPSQQNFPNNPDNQKKYFRLNWASGATLSAPIIQSPEYSLFVGDLSASTTEAHLLALFQKSFPVSIKTVRVMTDPVSGKSRCFGFVRFTDEAERQRALVEMNGVWFGGRPLRVALATPRNQVKPPPPPGVPPHLRTNGRGLATPRHDFRPAYDSPEMLYNYGYSAPSYMEPKPSPQGQPFADPNNTTVFVGGLSSDVTEPTLFTLFSPYGTIQQVKIPAGKNCGFIKYSTREEAEEAIGRMQGFIIGGNRVRLSWGRVSMNNKKFQHQQHQVAQAAQIQAAAALSMGMDPAAAIAAAAAAAGGYPPPHMAMSHPMGGPSYPSQPHYMHDPGAGSMYGSFRDKPMGEFGLDDSSLIHQMGSMHLSDDPYIAMGQQHPNLYMSPGPSTRRDKRDRK
ncbi:protein Nam8p [Diutina catenulata]